MRKILFVLDGSQCSTHAGCMPEKLLEAWPNAELTVLYVTVKENYAYDPVPEVVDHYE